MGSHFWLAVAAYLLPTFPLGYAWHLKTFRRQYAELGLYREEVIVPFGLTSMMIQALVFASVYPRLFGAGSEQWLSNGLLFGLGCGILAWSFAVLPAAAKYRMHSIRQFMVLETAFTIGQYLIVGPLIALAWRGAA